MKVLEIFEQPCEYGEYDPYKDFIPGKLKYPWYEEQNRIYEGLITTYGIGSSMGILQREWPSIRVKRGQNIYGLEGNDFSIKINLDIVPLKEIPKVFLKINTCGWFISTIDLFKDKQGFDKIEKNISFLTLEKHIDLAKDKNVDINFIDLYLEAKFDIEMDKKFLPTVLYHITPKDYKAKIEKNGLVPKSTAKSAEHPERIYLVANKSYAISDLYPELKARSKLHKHEPWIILTISMIDFPSHHQIFMDPNCPYAVYVLANISPYSIEDIEDL